MSGWIKLHRKTLDNPIVCKDSDHIAVWIYLLLNATHKEYSALFKGEKITLQPGQLLTGRKSISSELKISESKVTRILKSLEIEQQIEQQTSNKNRLISILSWTKYQSDEQQDEQQLNNKRTTTEQQVNTNKNVKNKRIEELKNIKDIVSSYSTNSDLVETLQSFIEFRKSIKKPMTEKAIKLLFNELDKLSKLDSEKIEILNQSIMNSWQSVYPLKSDKQSFQKPTQTKQGKPQIPTVQSNESAPTMSEEELARVRQLAAKLDGGS